MARLSDRLGGLTKVPQPQSPDKAGFVVDTAANTVPDGWLECNGQAVSRTTYSELFDEIGTTYGVGDGSTTFNLPDGSVLNNPTGTDEFVQVKTANGHGSTDTAIRRFSTVVNNTGGAITYADSATLGATFTINEDGIYWVHYLDIRIGNGTPEWAITRNSTTRTVGPSAVADSQLVSGWITDQDESGAAGIPSTYIGPLSAGDVLRAQTNANSTLSHSDPMTRFIIRQLFRT